MGVKLSCMEFTAPQEVSVVMVAQSEELADAEAHLLAFQVSRGLAN